MRTVAAMAVRVVAAVARVFRCGDEPSSKSPKGAPCDSPGQRPGKGPVIRRALKGRNQRAPARAGEWVSTPLCGRDVQSIIPPLQGWGICDPWTQGVALGYHIWPRWGQARSDWWIACRTVTAMIVRVAAAGAVRTVGAVAVRVVAAMARVFR